MGINWNTSNLLRFNHRKRTGLGNCYKHKHSNSIKGRECEVTEFTVDGFTFNLQKDNNRIYVFKGDAFVRAYIYPTYEEAKKDFDEAKTKKRVIFK